MKPAEVQLIEVALFLKLRAIFGKLEHHHDSHPRWEVDIVDED